MNKIFTKVAIATATLTLVAQVSNAIPITGNIGITGQATLDSSSVDTATAVTGWANTEVNGGTGVFASIPFNTAVTVTAPWSFATTTAIPSFWTVDGFTFELLTSYITAQGNGSITVKGYGIISGNGYTDSDYSWSFTTQDPASGSVNGNDTWTFSASSTSVPDGGTTMLLLGAALSGVALIKRKLSA